MCKADLYDRLNNIYIDHNLLFIRLNKFLMLLLATRFMFTKIFSPNIILLQVVAEIVLWTIHALVELFIIISMFFADEQRHSF